MRTHISDALEMRLALSMGSDLATLYMYSYKIFIAFHHGFRSWPRAAAVKE